VKCHKKAFFAEVLRVYDGDTIVVMHGAEIIKIRLSDIDAPELDQDYGIDARDFLAFNCEGMVVKVEPRHKDLYGRLLAKVYLPEQAETMQQFMVGNGMAWQYENFSRDKELRWLEGMSRDRGRGIWSRSDCVAPWKWRKTKKARRYQPTNSAVSWDWSEIES
jgi:micrococcal nuclease